MNFVYGKPLAEEILSELKDVVSQRGIVPGLAVILVGDDPASHIYVGLKERAARLVGIKFDRYTLPVAAREDEIRKKIETLNHDPTIHGIILQLPLPKHLNETTLVQTILPEKDADGFHSETLRRYFAGAKEAQPVFPRAVISLIQSTGINLAGEKAVVLVNSQIFGQVMQRSLTDIGLESTILLRQFLSDQRVRLREAKVVVVACGDPGLIKGEDISPGAIVIDGGITRRGDRVVGDVDLNSVAHLDGWIAPVPGGVGPLTVALLLSRVVELSWKQKKSGE